MQPTSTAGVMESLAQEGPTAGPVIRVCAMPAIIRPVPFRLQMNRPQREVYDAMRALPLDDQFRIERLVKRVASILASNPSRFSLAVERVEAVPVLGSPHLRLIRSPARDRAQAAPSIGFDAGPGCV